MGLTRVKEFNEQHLTLYRMVQQRGGAPKGKGTVSFWEGILKEWNDSFERSKSLDRHTFSHWQSIKITYERIRTKLDKYWYYTPGSIQLSARF